MRRKVPWLCCLPKTPPRAFEVYLHREGKALWIRHKARRPGPNQWGQVSGSTRIHINGDVTDRHPPFSCTRALKLSTPAPVAGTGRCRRKFVVWMGKVRADPLGSGTSGPHREKVSPAHSWPTPGELSHAGGHGPILPPFLPVLAHRTLTPPLVCFSCLIF